MAKKFEKKERMPEPEVPEMKEVEEEEIPVEETVVAEPEPKVEDVKPEPELKKPAPKEELPEGAVECRGMVKGKLLYVDAEGNNFFAQ